MSTAQVQQNQSTDTTDQSLHWGISAQTGKLTDVLLGRPDHFRWVPLNSISAVTFANMEKTGKVFDQQKAMEQHRKMAEVYEANGVRVHYVDADEGLPSSVFTRDSSFMTPWGAVITSIQTPVRRRDYSVTSEFYRNAGIPIWNWVTAGHFEGGDFCILKPGVSLLGWSGDRSTKEGAEQVQGWLEDEGWEVLVAPIPPQFVHMDAVVVMLEQGIALVCEDALPEHVLDFIKNKHGIETINVKYADCVKLGGNIVSLGEKRILSMSHNVNINAELTERGFDVTAVDYDMFASGGGGVHCSCHELHRETEE